MDGKCDEGSFAIIHHTVAAPQATEFGEFKAEVASLENSCLYRPLEGAEVTAKAEATGEPDPDLHCILGYAGTTDVALKKGNDQASSWG